MALHGSVSQRPAPMGRARLQRRARAADPLAFEQEGDRAGRDDVLRIPAGFGC